MGSSPSKSDSLIDNSTRDNTPLNTKRNNYREGSEHSSNSPRETPASTSSGRRQDRGQQQNKQKNRSGDMSSGSKARKQAPESEKSKSHRASRSQGASSSSQNVRVENDEFVFETFHHRSGRSYVCMYYGGQRYYLDNWDSQEWKPFPAKWHAEGNLVRDDGQTSGASTDDIDVRGGFVLSDNKDDRSGVFNHPKRGPLATYMVEEKRNVMYFYDDSIGMWVKMPAAWEAKADFLQPIVRTIKDAIPSWKDEIDIVAALRQSGYDPDDAIATFITVGYDDPLVVAGMKGTSEKQQETLKKQAEAIRQLEAKLKQNQDIIGALEKSLAVSQQKCEELELQLGKMRDEISGVKADKKNTDLQFQGMQREKTKLMREKTMLMESGSKKGAAAAGAAMGAAAAGMGADTGPKITKEMELMIKGANEKAKSLDKQQIALKDFVFKEFEKLKEMLKQLAESYTQLKGSETNLGDEIEEVRALYRKEMLQRKLLYNELQELRGNIRVFCRIKPEKTSCLTVSDDTISLLNVHGKKLSFEFDKIYDQKTTQSQLFDATKAVITSAVDGYNVCLIAYGQTGSGKTHTMMGPEKDPGVNLRAVEELFNVTKQRQNVSVSITANMLEVYNENVKDLLRDAKATDSQQINIRIVGKKVTVENAIEMPIKSTDDVKKMIKRGNDNRSVAQTKMNTNSSRSHLLLKINVELTDNVTSGRTIGSLTLVDLAGSEKIAKSGAEGQTLIEAAAINTSLSALGQVFTALRSKSVHVPYRNSKLTQLLQPSLGGDAKACIFVNCSPLESNMQETISTLEFGQNAKQVQLGKSTQNVIPPPKK